MRERKGGESEMVTLKLVIEEDNTVLEIRREDNMLVFDMYETDEPEPTRKMLSVAAPAAEITAKIGRL